MPRLKRQQSQDGQGNVVVAEFTNGQLVIMICLSLFVAAAVFAVGLLVARIDRSVTPATAVSTPAETPENASAPAQTYTIPAMDANATVPATATPPAVATPPAAPTPAATPPSPSPSEATPATPEPASPPSPPAAPPAAQETPNSTPPAAVPAQRILPPPVNRPKAVPPSPANRDTLMAAGRAPRISQLPPISTARPAADAAIRVQKPATPEGQTAPVVVQEAAAAAPAPAVTAPVPAPTAALTPIDPPVETAPGVTANTPVTDTPPATAANAPKGAEKAPESVKIASEKNTKATGAFAVQLASFSGPQRRAKAENFQKRVKSELNLNTTIVKSDDDSYYRVVISGYKDKNAASAACADLRKKTGLSEAFVRPL